MSRPHLRPVFATLPAVVALGAMCARPPIELPPLPAATGSPVAYREQVQPILDGRCVVCHGCYDAPCQLQLSSHAGLARGATRDAVYHSNRLIPTGPTRLFIDEKTTADWRERDFFSVLDGAAPDGSDALFLKMLALGRASPFAPDEKLPRSLPMDISRELSCPTDAEFDGYARKQRQGGMPYGMAPLSDAELGALVAWVQQGASPPPAPDPLPRSASAQVAAWETFLNGKSLKQRITARYLYEHWFLAHLTFSNLPAGPFFRVVRSTTPPGRPVDEIASRRPYDDPGTESFWYRLVPIESTVVHKTHIVYELSDAKRRRLVELFLAPSWQPTRLPSYDPDEASNPFVSFDQIPPRARYGFLLDDAQYFVMTFIRGPVCRGQIAVDVIEDHFWVSFFDPDRDVSVADPAFLDRTKNLLSLPAEHASHLAPGGISLEYTLKQKRYMEARAEAYDALDPERRGPTLEYIWDGDGSNRNAQLTVFRHFDSATVVKGFLGATPETAWVMDFPILERIYYDLVAGFDVFGNVTHQISTRLYMDHLRQQSEVLFLGFLPPDRREEIRASWYVGATGKRSYEANRPRVEDHGTQIPFTSSDAVAELLEMLAARNSRVSGPPDRLNRCARPPCDRPGATAVERRAERALQPLAGVRGPWVKELPELSVLRVRAGDAGGGDAIYTLVHNRAHTSVASMFEEDERLEPEKDTLTVARGYLGSYPNFLFEVEVAEVDEFTGALAAVRSAKDLGALVERFGLRRTSPRFWQTFDWIHDDFRRRHPTEAGLFDLNRYENL